MHPELVALFRKLEALRVVAGYSVEDVEEKLVMGPGWIKRLESGASEPSLGTLAALLNLYGQNLSNFFDDLDFGDEAVIVDRHLTAEENDSDLIIHFPMGVYAAQVVIPDATLDQFNQVLLVLRDSLASAGAKDAIVSCFLKAVEVWPHANPSDLWYFLVSHAYQDDYNHPATSAGKDWSQSWKRAGGWSLEAIYVDHYNKYLITQGLRLAMPDPIEKKRLLALMGMNSSADVEKSDVLVLGKTSDGVEHPFGVVHVKASFAERRTDDAPLSVKLIQNNYVSPLLTMDCKANPSGNPINKGELGPVQGGADRVSSKRLDIEKDRIFDAVFVYNTNTLPTPIGTSAAARIYVCSFSDPNDSFAEHLIRKWKDRQGI